jgi:UDP-N-acetylmuramyl pentapeptide phosphotransferase/UDP-N-acetylglucosamine-1-phosphate transferase
VALRTAAAFAAAALTLLVAASLSRSLARKRGWQWPRRSGGVLLVLTVPVAFVAAFAVSERATAIAIAAVALAAFGLWRDRGELPRWLMPTAVAVAAVLVTATGDLRFMLGGVDWVDFGWTVIWLVAVTACVAGLGNADGLVAGVASASAFGVVAVAGFAQQGLGSTVPAALLGGLVGFLAFNMPPASLSIGSAGSLFAGFVLAACALWAQPAIGKPDSLLVSVLLVAVPLLDGVVVVVGRLRRGHPIMVRARDHLAHRLVGSGMRPGRAVWLLVAAQFVLSLVAVPLARGVLAPAIAAVVAAAVLFAVFWTAMRARLRGQERHGGRVALVVFGFAVIVVLACIPAGVAAYASRSEIDDGRDAAVAALRAARRGNTDQAAALFATAEREFESAHDRLDSPLTAPGLVVPVVGSNLDAARTMAQVGTDLARAGRQLTEQVDPDTLHFVDGRVPLETVATVTPLMEEASAILARSKADLDRVDRAYLVGQVEDGVQKLRRNLTKAATEAARGAAAARIAPLVLGQDAPRRYLLVVQNPAELRGTGGLIGNWGILTASNGTVHLDSLERVASLNQAGDPSTRVLNAPEDYVARYARYDPARQWQSVNISPDFPTVASVMADLYGQSFGVPVDGVLAVDPHGLAALLALTGPVRVDGWRTPINARNVVDVTLRDAYAEFARTPERADFLGDHARVAIDRATDGDLGAPARLGEVLGRAAHEGHISLWLAKPREQRVSDELAISGRVPEAIGDTVMVSNTNAGANKLDYYLTRGITYSATVTPSGDLRRARTQGTLDVELQNHVPPEGVPQIAAGPYEGATDRFVYGQNRSYLSVYTPLDLVGARVGDDPVFVESNVELGRNVYSHVVDVFAQGTVRMALDVGGTVRLADRGWYELTLVRQPTVRPDRVSVRVAVPDGFEIRAAPGLEVVDGVAQGTVDVTRTKTLRVQIGHSDDRNLWQRLEDGP